MHWHLLNHSVNSYRPGRGRVKCARSTAIHTLAAAAVLAAVASASPDAVRADAVGAEAILLSLHVLSQRDAPVEHYERRIDAGGQAIVTPGIELYFDRSLTETLWNARALRVTAALLEDSVRHRFGYLHLGAVWWLHESERWAIILLFGPGFIFRESWRDIPGYDPDNPLEESDTFLPGYEYKFLPLGSLDLLYRLDPTWQAVWSVFPGVPYVILLSLGFRASL